SVDRCPQSGSKVPVAPRDRGVPRKVADITFPDGAQLVTLSGGLLWECYGSGIVATRDLFVACFRLSWGQVGYYLTTRIRFRVGVAPSSNKGWNSSFFNRTFCYAEMFNLGRMKSSNGGGSESVVSLTTSASATAASTIEKRPSTSEGVSLKKHNKKEALEQPTNALESTTRAPTGKGKEPM
ncbi:hypothetical protein BHE74_00049917, partial [Ensete ventricosum]